MSANDDLEWEEWDRNKLSFVDHMIAGSIAGLAEHCSIFPFDTIKTNMQCEKCGSTSPFQTLTCAERIIRKEGIFRLWRGVSAMFAGCLPAHAAYFSVFESMKTISGADQDGHHPIAAAICGATAGFSHDCIMIPFDVIKQRMQLGYHRTVFECGVSIYKSEGFLSFYRSFPTTVIMNVPYGCIMVAVNESVKKILNPGGGYNIQASMIAGSMAGAVAAFVTTPLDVVKTRLQTQGMVFQEKASTGSSTCSSGSLVSSKNFTPPILKSNLRYFSMSQTITRIAAEEGISAFLKGVFPRMLVQAPSVAVSWTTYEFVKSCLASIKSSYHS